MGTNLLTQEAADLLRYTCTTGQGLIKDLSEINRNMSNAYISEPGIPLLFITLLLGFKAKSLLAKQVCSNQMKM